MNQPALVPHLLDSDPQPIEPRYGPRERILQLGEHRLSDAECIALLLRTGQRGEPAEAMAQRLLRHCGGLTGLAAAEVRQVAAVPGIGAVRAAALGAAFGLARRLSEARFRPGTPLRTPGDVARVVLDTVRGSRCEHFFALLLDTRNRVLSFRTIGTGSLDDAPAHPREVFAAAIREGAASVILAHNHPSGDPTPSASDQRATERLRAAGTLLGIDVLDHVVVGGDRYFSFVDNAVLPLPS